MILDRIPLADIGEPTRLAAAILDQFAEVPNPVPVEDIALALDISDIKTLKTEGFEGGLVAPLDKSEGVILVNSRSPRHRRRFSVGHELGHFVNPWHISKDGQQFLCSEIDMRRSRPRKGDRVMQMEVEANRFAAELLLPRRTFVRDLCRSAGPDLGHVVRLADKYDMSKEATARRYIDLHDEPLAVVFSRNGTVRYPYRSREFPYLDVEQGCRLPPGCVSVTKSGRPGVPSDWAEVDAGVWLGDKSRPRTVLEQTLAQANGFHITLLALDTAEVEEAEDDADLKASWTPLFRR